MLRYELIGSRALLTIDDAEHHNPMSNELMSDLAAAVVTAASTDEVRAIVLTGAGDKAFSAGGDLRGGFVDDPVATHSDRRALVELIRALRGSRKPTVARVNGNALGGGFGLAAACDIVIAADHAVFGTPEIRLGLWPMMITAVLQPLVPQKALFEMMATGQLISAVEAMRLGVVSRVVPAAQLDAAVDETVDALAAVSPAAMAFGKDAFYTASNMDFDTALDYLQTGLTALATTHDAREGVAAFSEKRDPEWRGS